MPIQDKIKDMTRITSTAELSKLCDFIDKKEQTIHALLPEQDFKKRLLGEYAASKDAALPLHGILVGVKDIFRVNGFPTKAGSRLPASVFEGNQASSIDRLKQAGAIVLGKTVSTEFAYFEPGPTRNPVNPEYTPGGSSSGSAAAVAAGYCQVALGSQTIGSVIRPASFCGILGFKPSFGRIPLDGVIPFSAAADHVGVFTRDIQTMVQACAVLCDNWMLGSPKKAKPVIGVPHENFLQQADTIVLDAFESQIEQYIKAGFSIKRINMLDDIEQINKQHKQMVAREFARVHEQWYSDYGDLYGHHAKELIKEGLGVSNTEYQNAYDGRIPFRDDVLTAMDVNQIDMMASPSTMTPPTLGIDSTGSPIMNLPWTYAGLPTLTIPAGFTDDGLPLGTQLTGKYDKDEDLLGFAAQMIETN
jgi:Asp-tRNA(Asn)/Glu-tRNA(Gln) amidotransferase A subunit family amidase